MKQVDINITQQVVKVDISVASAASGVITEQAIIDALGYNPTTEIELAQKAIAGIVDFNLTAVAGTTHTITIIPEHSGKTLDVRANLDDVVTILVGNDIVLNQPITIRKTGVFSVELRAANTDIVIEANDVLDDAGVDYVDISGETFNTVQVMKASDNVIWGIGI